MSIPGKSKFEQMVEQNPTLYPARMGKKWENDEFIKLLSLIQKKKTIDEIALEHERTVGSIRSQIRQLAADYYFNDKRPIEEIVKFTGLTKEEIEYTIKIRENKILSEAAIKENIRTNKIKNTKKVLEPSVPVNSDMKEVIARLNDIQSMLAVLIEKVQ
jgi:hypothetical protein